MTSKYFTGKVLWLWLVGLLLCAPAMAYAPFSDTEGIEGQVTELAIPLQATSDRVFQEEMEHLHPEFARFTETHGPDWFMRLDRRTLRPAMVWGSGIAWHSPSMNVSPDGRISVTDSSFPSLEAHFDSQARSFMREFPGFFNLDVAGNRLVLDPTQTVSVRDGKVWALEYGIRLDGVPVQFAQLFFRVNSGNLIQFGTRHISDALSSAPTRPARSIEAARAVVAKYAGGLDEEMTRFSDHGTLLLLPIAENARIFTGTPGEGLDYRLAWRFSFTRDGEIPTWTAYVDATSGTMIAFYDDNKYACIPPIDPHARVTGGIYPRHPNDTEVVRGMPNTLVGHGGPLTTDYNGVFPQTPGVLSETSMGGTFFDINCSACTNPSQPYVSNLTGGDLRLGTGGTNTVGNGYSTKAGRNTFYHVNVARAMAAKFLNNGDTNGYLDRNAPANVNIANNCNAFWDGNSINMFSAGGGCNNTGEIADVIQHEWGHGLDQYTTPGGVWDGARGEGLSDIVAFLATHSPVMSPYFRVGDAGGIRNCDEWNGPRGILTVSNLLNKCPAGNGPNGGQVHCEGELFSQTNWRLGVNLRNKYGEVAGWFATERLFFGHLPLADTYVPDQGGSAYDAYMAVDDDDGNLANGTPNGESINDAFEAHEIASTPLVGDAAECTPPVAPVPVLTVQSDTNTNLYQVKISWNSAPAAVQYDVLRNEDGPDAMGVIIATILPPFPPDPIEVFDNNVNDGETYYYRIRIFDNQGCSSINDTNQSVVVAALSRIDFQGHTADDTAGNANGIVEPGETINLPVSVFNPSIDANNVVGTIDTGTPGITIVDDTADYGLIISGAADTTDAPHFTFQIANDPSLCGETIVFALTLEADEGCSYSFFEVPIGVFAGYTTLFSDDMEVDSGWTVDPEGNDDATTGIWVREDPNQTGFQPDTDHTPGGTQCWITGNLDDPGNGADDVDDGCTTLQSPVWDLTGQSGVELSYWRHYVLETRLDDELLVEISNDGGNAWQVLERVTQTTTPFTEATFDLDDVLGASLGQIALRFTACDTGGGSLVEALIDDVTFRIPQYDCEDATPKPRLDYVSFSVDDGITGGEGNGDTIADPGETIILPIMLTNIGNELAQSVTATLRLGAGAPAGTTVIDDYATYADMPVGSFEVSGGPAPDHYTVKLPNGAHNCGEMIPFELDMNYTDGTTPYTATAAFEIQLGIVTMVDLFVDDFEAAGDNGWTHAEIAEQDDWQHDSPSGLNVNDPPAAYSGTRIWGNDLANGNWDGDYRANVHNYLESPVVDMQISTNSRLIFQRWLTVEDGLYDQAIVSVNGTVIWQNPAGTGGDHVIDTAWVEQEFDISAIADGNPAVQVRFELISDGGLQFGGWNIDDFRLLSEDAECHPYGCSAPLPDAVGNLLRMVKNGAVNTLDWSAYSGNAFSYNGYLAVDRVALPIGPTHLTWPLIAATTLDVPVGPTDPPLEFFQVRAVNECDEEELP